MKHDTGEVVYTRYLPIDNNGNNMQMNGLHVEMIDSFTNATGTYTDRMVAFYRYRRTAPIMQTFAAIKFGETNNYVDYFKTYGPDPTAGKILGAASIKYGWFSTYVMSDKTNSMFYVVVHADMNQGTFVYGIDFNLVNVRVSQIPNAFATSSEPVEIQSCLYNDGTTNMILIPSLDNKNYVDPVSSTVTSGQAEVIRLTMINRATFATSK